MEVSKNYVLSKEYLEEEYSNKGRTARDIGAENGYKNASFIHECLRRYGIDRRNRDLTKILTKEVLQKLYVDEELSTKAISRQLEVNQRSVIEYLRLYGIKVRDMHRRHRKDGSISNKWHSHRELSGHYFRVVCYRAATKNMGFDISIEYAYELFEKQERKCALSGVPITLANPYSSEQTASLDRIDSSLGYVKGNLQWVHKAIQPIKGGLDENEFFGWVKKIYEWKLNK